MNHQIRQSAFIALSAAAVFLSPCAAFGAVKVDVTEKPKLEDVMSPEFGGVRSKAFRAKNWLEIEVKIKIQMKPEPKTKTCDKVTLKWYVAVENPEKSSTMLKLTKEIEYVNVPVGDDVFCNVYLSPASIKHLTGFDRSGKSAIKYAAFEVLIDGKVVAEATDKGPPKWWSIQSDHIADSTTVPLLNKMETPFAAVWWDRYPEIKGKTP